jgi:hypothetical protein
VGHQRDPIDGRHLGLSNRLRQSPDYPMILQWWHS